MKIYFLRTITTRKKIIWLNNLFFFISNGYMLQYMLVQHMLLVLHFPPFYIFSNQNRLQLFMWKKDLISQCWWEMKDLFKWQKDAFAQSLTSSWVRFMFPKMLCTQMIMLSLVPSTKSHHLAPKDCIGWLTMACIKLLTKAWLGIQKIQFSHRAWMCSLLIVFFSDWSQGWSWWPSIAPLILKVISRINIHWPLWFVWWRWELWHPFYHVLCCEREIVISQGPSETHVLVLLTSTNVVHSVVDLLKVMSQIRHTSNELRSLDYAMMNIEVINFLPMKFDSDVLFELPHVYKLMGVSKQMQGMDRKYVGHAWCKVKMTKIKNAFGLGFQSIKYLGHLWCQNDSCFVFLQSATHNEVDWSDDLSQDIVVSEIVLPLLAYTIACKVCGFSPICVQTCICRMYYVVHLLFVLSRATIHLGTHVHHASKGKCKESLEDMKNMVVEEVLHMPNATSSTIALVASKVFLFCRASSTRMGILWSF